MARGGPRRSFSPSAHPQAIILAPTDGGLAVARAVHRRGLAVSMLVEGPWRWIGRTRWADSRVLGQLPGDQDGWLDCLSELARARGEGVLLPCTDRTSELLIAERARIPVTLRSFESRTRPISSS